MSMEASKEQRTDFIWEYTDEPHATRRKEILAKYPQIKRLFGHDWRITIQFVVIVFIQVYMSYLVQDCSWPLLIILTHGVSGSLNHILSVGLHEICHNLAFGAHRPMANRLLGFFANLPLGMPSFITFKRYHIDHHKYLAVADWDPDLPTRLEAKLFSSRLGKFIYLFLLPYVYAFRPLIYMPKNISRYEVVNFVIQATFDLAILNYFGYKSLFYLIMGSWLGLGFHPISGHFIAEHYVFVDGYETYSYYGVLNWIMFNVGYHNEHHDFPNIPCYRLPEVRKIAPEYYNDLPSHYSWVRVLWDFVCRPDMGPYARVHREYEKTSEYAILNRRKSETDKRLESSSSAVSLSNGSTFAESVQSSTSTSSSFKKE